MCILFGAAMTLLIACHILMPRWFLRFSCLGHSLLAIGALTVLNLIIKLGNSLMFLVGWFRKENCFFCGGALIVMVSM